MDSAYPVFFSQYRKAKQKAQQIWDNLQDIQLPKEEARGDSSPPPTPPRSYKKLFWILYAVVTLFSLIFYFLSYPTTTSSWEYKILYGEAQIQTKNLISFRTHGEKQSWSNEEEQTLSTDEKPMVLSFSENSLIEMHRKTKITLNSRQGKRELLLREGEIFIHLQSAFYLNLPSALLFTSQGSAYLKRQGDKIEIGILAGKFELPNKEILSSSLVHLLEKGKLAQAGPARLPDWFIPVQEIPSKKWEHREVASSSQTPVSIPSKENNEPVKTSPLTSLQRPEYPYEKPEWKTRMERELKEKKITLESKGTTLENLVSDLAIQSSSKIGLDPLLNISFRESKFQPHFNKTSLEECLRWIIQQKPALKYVLDQGQVLIVSENYASQMDEKEKILLGLSYAKEFRNVSKKKLINLDEFLRSKNLSIKAENLPLEEILKKIQPDFSYGLEWKSLPEKKLSLDVTEQPSSKVLQDLLSPFDLSYGPKDPSGRLLITTSASAKELWKEYERLFKIQQEVLQEEKDLRKNLLSPWVEVDFSQKELWEILQLLSQKTSLPIYVEKKLWNQDQKFSWKGRASLGQVLENLFSSLQIKMVMVEPYIFFKICRPNHRDSAPPRGLYLFLDEN